MISAPRLLVSTEGLVEEILLAWAKKTLEDCYQRISRSKPEFVELKVFEKDYLMRAFLAKEKEKIGIDMSMDESFITTHDAWSGIPRICVSFESMKRIGGEVSAGALQHEVAHSVLHGSLEYYIIRVPESFFRAASQLGLAEDQTVGVAYLLAVAVKDFGATKLLVENRILDEQVAFAKYCLRHSEDEEIGWILARASTQIKVMFLTSMLKVLACAAPLRGVAEMEDAIQLYLKFLPSETRDSLLETLYVFEDCSGIYQEDMNLVFKEVTMRLHRFG